MISRAAWIRPLLVLCSTTLTPALLAQAARADERAGDIDFNRDIKPILSNVCYKCHGPDPAERKGGTDGLRLDTYAGATADLGDRAAIVPGDADKSELVLRISTQDPNELMPPPSSGRKLTPREVRLLTDWVRQGAKYVQHWSYVKPIRPAVPVVKDTAWPRNAIDNFLLARLERDGLKPSPEADRYALIRRLSLDITGLPPSIAEVDAFVNDTDPQAYEKLVDALLRKPSYGEHWGHMWLDLARYADSAGYADDPLRTIWLFRDYVIRSLNANKPFDQFTIEQIAGDLLPEPTEDQLIATSFHRNTLTNSEGGTNDEEFRTVAIVDRVNTTMAVWMGTTIACAQCHNHKYDPISQEEFFRFYAIFNNTEDADRRDESPLLDFFTDEQKQQQSRLTAEIAQLEKVLQTPTPELQAAQARWEQAFPLDLKWSMLKPAEVKSQAGMAATIDADASVRIAAGAKNDTYTLQIPLEASTLRALRLEALPDDTLPGKGPGHAAGNFILTRATASIVAPATQQLSGRFVRVELPGKQKMLSLAEVQVFRGAENLALKGEARQISTDYQGDAKRAIDGQTDGRYFEANSTTHTAAGDDPWWEVDLKETQALDRIVVWNRTDPGVGDRLAQFRVLLLNEKREPVWEQTVASPPQPSAALAIGGARNVDFTTVAADYSQAGFEAERLLSTKDPKPQGWAVGGEIGRAHALTLITGHPIDIAAGSVLTVTIEHASPMPNQTLGKFRLSLTADPRTAEWARAPAAVIAALGVAAPERNAAQSDQIVQYFRKIAQELAPQREQLAALRTQLAELKPATVPIMRELPQAGRRVTNIQFRGNFMDLGKVVTEGTPEVFPPLPEGVAPNRLAVAQWLIDPDNPLTGRVIANRFWEQIFGIGIVSSSEEFGAQGEQPFHPELLDYLATELVRLKWDMKAFVKLLVMSAAYRQSSRVTPELQHLDPDNRLLARGPRFRLSAEMIRDQALAASGLLSARMYGPPVKPPQPTMGLSAAFGSGTDWQTSGGEDKYRRALYTMWRRSNPYPSMATFDAPNREVCTVRRGRTNTPLQALVTLNDPVYIEAAQAFARRVVTQGGSNLPDRMRFAFRLCLSRPPHENELARLVELYEQALKRFEQQPEEATRLATDPLGPVPPTMAAPELAAWTTVGNVLMNLDEALMKR